VSDPGVHTQHFFVGGTTLRVCKACGRPREDRIHLKPSKKR
jgi:hypothetical protein